MKVPSHQHVRSLFRRSVWLLLATLLALQAQAARGGKFFKEGRKAELRAEYDQALVNYEKALAEDPQNAQYLLGARRTRFLAAMQHVDRGHKLRDQGKLADALAEFERAFAIDPSSSIAESEVRRTLTMLEAQKKGAAKEGKPEAGLTPQQAQQRESEQRLGTAEGPAELTPLSRAPINLKATNDSKIIFETIGKLAGINVLSDPDYQSRRTSVELNNVTLEQALDHVAVLSKSLWKPLTSNTILIYPDNKRREHEEQVIKTFYLSNTIQPQELTEIAQVIRNLLEMRFVQQVNSQNALVIRDTPDKVAIAEKIISDIDKSKPEVVVEVTVMQVRRDRTRDLGITPVSGGSPGLQVPVTFAPGGTVTTSTGTGTTGTTTTTTSPSTSVALRRLGSLSSNDFSLILPGASLNALMTDARTKILQNPQVRASDGQAAKLRIGERVPVATGSFQPGIGGVGINPLVNTQFQYLDVGVILEITPKVHAAREVSLKVAVEISQVTSRVNIGGIDQPVIGQRRVEEEIRLREGEINVLGGIIETQETSSVAGLPILGQIPLLGRLFSTEHKTAAENEVLIVLTPRILRLPEVTELNLRGIDIGTQANMQLRYRAPAVAAGGGARTAVAPAPPPKETPAAPAPPPKETPAAPAPPPSVPSGVQLRFQEATSDQTAGSVFNLNLEVANAQDVHSAEFRVRFDPKLLKLVNVVDGAFLRADAQPVAVVQRVDAEAGTANISLNRPPAAGGRSGSGVLVTLSFQAAGPGTATVEVLRGSLRNPEQESSALPATRAAVTIK